MTTLDVVLEVPLVLNSVVDFTQLAEAKYGFEALHPTIATADDLLVDEDDDEMDNDQENENDLENDQDNDQENDPDPDHEVEEPQEHEQTYENDEDRIAQLPNPQKKQKRKIGKYDLNDPFIDDAEMQWEATAAATKDGFFVYSGVIEADDSDDQIDKSKKTSKRSKKDSETNPPKKRKYVKKKDKQLSHDTDESKPADQPDAETESKNE